MGEQEVKIWSTILAVVIMACLCGSCGRRAAEGSKSSTMSKAEALELVSRIKVGMTFSEVAQIIPLSTNDIATVTHGGMQCATKVRGYVIQMRFDVAPRRGPPYDLGTVAACKLNRPATLQAYMGGPALNHPRTQE
jgi:CheY-specific phosphatase CheX